MPALTACACLSNLPKMEVPVREQMQRPLFQQDETYSFFLKDASHRLDRASEQAMAFGIFALLLYCRLTCPGGYDAWKWFEDPGFWWVVFLPLLAMDVRHVQHALYLRRNSERFTPYDASRFSLIAASECVYKIALCIYLSVPSLEKQDGGSVSLKMVMIPFAVGYVAHFILGHCMPLEEELVRAEGCNAVAWLVSELGRFLEIVLVVSLSIKVEDVNHQMYDWQAAFWPGWGLEGMLVLLLALLVPMLPCLLLSSSWSRVIMVVWIGFAAIIFGISLGLTMTNVANVLNNTLCSGLPEGISDPRCHNDLSLAIAPWILSGPAFAIVTAILNRRLSLALHEAWYAIPRQAASPNPGHAGGEVEVWPAPEVLFRVTPTFYSRDPMPDGLPEDGASVALGSAIHYSLVPSSLGGRAGGSAAQALPSMALDASTLGTSVSVLGSVLGSRHHDHAGSVMSARGAAYAQLVESEQLCFICYTNRPDAVLLECGHAGLCTECASRMMDRQQANCPICRRVIAQVVELRDDIPVSPHLFTLVRADSSSNLAIPGPMPPCGASSKAVGVCDVDDSSLAESQVIVPGPPWPTSARKSAVSVRLLRQYQRPSSL